MKSKPMTKKYLNGSHWKWCEKSSAKIIYIIDILNGYISLVNIEKVKYEIMAKHNGKDICVFDAGFKYIAFLPDDENWCVTVIYNKNNELILWYFDIAKDQSIDKNGNPFFYDVFLDVVVFPNSKPKIKDEDELYHALDNKIITTDDVEMANRTAKEIIEQHISNKEFMEDFFEKYFDILNNK